MFSYFSRWMRLANHLSRDRPENDLAEPYSAVRAGDDRVNPALPH